MGLWEPKIGKFGGSADHKTKAKRTKESAQTKQIVIDIDKHPYQQAHYHEHLAFIKTLLHMSVPSFNPFLSKI